MFQAHAVAGLALVFAAVVVCGAWVCLLPRARAAVRSESELIAALGAPLIAARPLAAEKLAEQLGVHWFRRGRPILAVVGAEKGEGRTRVAAELARAFARAGERTLLIDADFRSPGVHRAFGLANRQGLADFLEGRASRLARCADNLSVLVAGRVGTSPLELLSRSRMQALLAAAAERYSVVLVDTPAAERGPDLQLPAAFAGGALVVTKFSSHIPPLKRLHQLLLFCRATVVGAVLSPV